MKKFATGLLLGLLICQLMTVGAWAAESRTYADVCQDSAWAESISFVTDQGIAAGTGRDRFEPERPISLRQWVVMLQRAFGNLKEGKRQFGEAELADSLKKGWISREDMEQSNRTIELGNAFEIAFQAAGLECLDYDLYPEGYPMTKSDNHVRVAKELGLCREDAASTDVMSRGEAAHIIHLLLTEEQRTEVPPMVKEVNLENRDHCYLKEYLEEIELVPPMIRQRFHQQNWRYIMDTAYIDAFSQRIGKRCIGACSFKEHTLYFSDPTATLHEFGHFLHYTLRFPEEIKELYEAESEKAAQVLKKYSTTDTYEYFAEYFAFWIRHSGEPQALARLQSLSPKTYAYFSRLSTSGWQ